MKNRQTNHYAEIGAGIPLAGFVLTSGFEPPPSQSRPH